MQVNQCPQCKTFIFGYFCYKCNKDIRDMNVSNDMPEFFKDIFGGKK